jgi:hypothetical protein
MAQTKPNVVLFVQGGLVQEVFADDANVFLIDIDESDVDGGPHEWNIGKFGTTPLEVLRPYAESLFEKNDSVRVLVEAVEA